MTRIDALLEEFTHETKTARKHLERLPVDQFEWRPHPKSFTAGQLASHIVDCVRWVEPIFAADELDMDAMGYQPFNAKTVETLLDAFEGEVPKANKATTNRAYT